MFFPWFLLYNILILRKMLENDYPKVQTTSYLLPKIPIDVKDSSNPFILMSTSKTKLKYFDKYTSCLKQTL